MIILDFGSGNTCNNNKQTVRNMIVGLKDVDPTRQCVIKWQLWDAGTEPQCTRLEWDVFDYAFHYAQDWGFRTTSSVFDKPSLDFLLGYDIPFVKLANRPYLRHLARYIPRGIPIVASRSITESIDRVIDGRVDYMVCVSNYPAKVEEYGDHAPSLTWGISDHTVGLTLWRKYHPSVWEKHYRLPDSTGPDAGPWAIAPGELVEVLGGRV